MSSALQQAEAAVAALRTLDLQGLRQVWADRYGDPPALRSPEMLRRLLAWRLQAEAAPGAISALRTRLGEHRATAPSTGLLQVGSVVAREWKGREHRAEVLENGRVLYDGAAYDSLSAVARTITGVRWNGPRFFGLRAPEAGSAP